MKTTNTALVALLALSVIFTPFSKADSVEPASNTQLDAIGENDDIESLDLDEPDQDPVYDEDDPTYDEENDYESNDDQEDN